MKNVAFHSSPKINHAFGLLLIETMSPRTFKNRQSGPTDPDRWRHAAEYQISEISPFWRKKVSDWWSRCQFRFIGSSRDAAMARWRDKDWREQKLVWLALPITFRSNTALETIQRSDSNLSARLQIPTGSGCSTLYKISTLATIGSRVMWHGLNANLGHFLVPENLSIAFVCVWILLVCA